MFPYLFLSFGFLQEVFHCIHCLLETFAFVDLDHLFFVGVVGLQLFNFDPCTVKIKKTQMFGTGKNFRNPFLDMKKTIGRKDHHHPLLHTYWSSVPKNFTKWHFFPRGFFRSLGGLTTWCVQIQYWHHWSIHNRYITQVIKSKRDRTLIKVVTAYLPRPWWVASKFSPASKTHTTLSAYSPWPTHVTTR